MEFPFSIKVRCVDTVVSNIFQDRSRKICYMEYKSPAEPYGLTRPLSLGRQLNFAAGARMTMCNTMLEQFGLTLPQWVVLSALWRQDHLTIGEIAGL